MVKKMKHGCSAVPSNIDGNARPGDTLACSITQSKRDLIDVFTMFKNMYSLAPYIVYLLMMDDTCWILLEKIVLLGRDVWRVDY